MIRKYLWRWYKPISEFISREIKSIHSHLDQNDGEIRNLIYDSEMSINNIEKLSSGIQNLVDRVKQLEDTVQCLSDENQKLMGMIYSKSTVNEILKGE